MGLDELKQDARIKTKSDNSKTLLYKYIPNIPKDVKAIIDNCTITDLNISGTTKIKCKEGIEITIKMDMKKEYIIKEFGKILINYKEK